MYIMPIYKEKKLCQKAEVTWIISFIQIEEVVSLSYHKAGAKFCLVQAFLQLCTGSECDNFIIWNVHDSVNVSSVIFLNPADLGGTAPRAPNSDIEGCLALLICLFLILSWNLNFMFQKLSY